MPEDRKTHSAEEILRPENLIWYAARAVSANPSYSVIELCSVRFGSCQGFEGGVQ